ncbi:unnamed protein product [Cunninghamella blakesleeana]
MGQTGQVFHNTIQAFNGQYVVPNKKIGYPLKLSEKPFTWNFNEQYNKKSGAFGDIVQYSSKKGIVDILFDVDGQIITQKLPEDVRHPFEFHPQGEDGHQFTITANSFVDGKKYLFQCWEVVEYTGTVGYNSNCNRDEPHPSQVFTLKEAKP